MDLTMALKRFDHDLDREGAGFGPNGAHYRAVPRGGDGWAVERMTRPPESITHATSLIVGTRGRVFDSRTAALSWALWDGRQSNPGAEAGREELV